MPNRPVGTEGEQLFEGIWRSSPKNFADVFGAPFPGAIPPQSSDPMKTLTPRLAPSSLALGLMTAIAALGASSAFAQATWVGDTSQDWNDATNWSSDPAAPTGNFTVNTATGSYPVLSADSAFTPVDIFIGNGAAGRLDHNAGLLSAGAGNWSFVGNGAGGDGTYNLTGSASFTSGRLLVAQGGSIGTVNINTSGTVTANAAGGDWWNSSGILIGVDNGSTATVNLQAGTIATTGTNANLWVGGLGGNGTLTQTGGTINVEGTLSLARYWGAGTMSVTDGVVNAGAVNLSHAGAAVDNVVGTLTLNSGATLNSAGDVTVGFAGNATSEGTLNVNSGAVLNVGATGERWLVVNQWDTAQGTVNVDGGAINLNANSDLRFSTGNSTGASEVNLNSGAITSYSGNGTGSSTSGVVDLNQAGGASANNTFNLNGGTLTTAQVITNNDNGTATFNFNGGTLAAANTSANFVDLGGAGQTAVVLAGGAIIDSNGFDVTMPQALLGGVNDGGLTKNGLGTLTLSGANTFVGDTTVNAGGLTIDSAGSLLFAVTDIDSTSVLGSGAFAFDGTMRLDLSSVTVGSGSWQLIDSGSLAESFGGTFSVVDANGLLTFADNGDVWTSNDGLWAFSELDGSLTLSNIPEPSAYAMMCGALALGAVALRRRRRA